MFRSTLGAAQGSILGPLLFLKFVSDITSYFKNAEIILFADDIKIYMSVNTVLDCNMYPKAT